MEKWLESVYSDSSQYYVSNPIPSIGETIRISIRMYEDSPIKSVFFKYLPNGAHNLIEMHQERVENGLAYYSCDVFVNEELLRYQFYLVTDTAIYYYTQKEITTYVPDHTYDFKILANYQQPKWVKGAVFYQIFPDRFHNGNEANDVQDGEYTFDGHSTTKVKDWNTPAAPYEEGFCLDFYGGDLEGVTAKIPYLQRLGVTAIYLNPIFYAATNHKYDCLDYFTVDPHFGGDKALQELSEKLHENDMQLIVDISINHTGTAHKWFNKNGEFFDLSEGAYNNKDSKERQYYFFDDETNQYDAWFNVETLPTLNYTSDELREEIYRGEDSVLKKWLKPPFSIDGWRFDVADVMARNNEIQLHHEVWPEIRKSIKETNPEAYILAEDWGDCAEFLEGDEWDSPMNYFGCGRPVRQFVGEPDLFNMRNEALINVKYKMTAKDLAARITEHLSKLPTVIQEVQFNLFDSHDVSRLHNHPNVKWEEYRGATAMLFTLPGATNMYYGDEAGIDGNTEFTIGCRYPMPWGTDFEQSEYYNLYQTLAHLKQENEAFIDGGFKIISSNDYVFAYARFTDKQAWITVCSTDSETREVVIPIKAYGKSTFDKTSDVFEYELTHSINPDGDLVLTVPAHTSYLFEL